MAATVGLPKNAKKRTSETKLSEAHLKIILSKIDTQKKNIFPSRTAEKVKERICEEICKECIKDYGFDPRPPGKDWRYILDVIWKENNYRYQLNYPCNGWGSNAERGHALIMDNGIPNQGVNMAKTAFSNLGYSVCTPNELTPGGMIEEFQAFVDTHVKETDDAVVVVIMSDTNFDSAKLKKLLMAVRVHKLKGMPKLFFIEVFDSTHQDGPGDLKLIHDIPELDADVLVSYSFTPGNPEIMFIKTLSTVLNNHGKRFQIPHIVNMMTEVRNKTGINRNCVKSSLKKLFYFTNPSNDNQENTVSASNSSAFSEAYRYNLPVTREQPLKPVLFKGVALIINNMEFMNIKHRRAYSDIDRRKLEASLIRIGYSTFVSENLTKKEMIDAFEKFKNLELHKKADSAIVVIMSHGELHKILTYEGQYVELEVLWNTLKSDQCINLKGKPKLFFIQACRDEYDQSETTESQSDESFTTVTSEPFFVSERQYVSAEDKVGLVKQLPGEEDFLIMYACSEGRKAIRAEYGSPFVKSLCKILEENGNHQDIETLLTKVNNKVGQICKMQTSQYCSSLTKYFYINEK